MPWTCFLLGFAITLVAAAFTITGTVLGPPARATEANAKRLKPGMILPEVQTILGGPPTQCTERVW